MAALYYPKGVGLVQAPTSDWSVGLLKYQYLSQVTKKVREKTDSALLVVSAVLHEEL